MVEEARKLCQASFIRMLILFLKAEPPKSPLPNAVTLGIRISTYAFEGNINIQSIAGTHQNHL
jgi:hypothetical protein